MIDRVRYAGLGKTLGIPIRRRFQANQADQHNTDVGPDTVKQGTQHPLPPSPCLDTTSNLLGFGDDGSIDDGLPKSLATSAGLPLSFGARATRFKRQPPAASRRVEFSIFRSILAVLLAGRICAADSARQKYTAVVRQKAKAGKSKD